MSGNNIYIYKHKVVQGCIEQKTKKEQSPRKAFYWKHILRSGHAKFEQITSKTIGRVGGTGAQARARPAQGRAHHHQNPGGDLFRARVARNPPRNPAQGWCLFSSII